MSKEIDYKSIISDLNEFLDKKALQDRFSFNYDTNGYMNRILFEYEVLWSDDIDPINVLLEEDWTTETLLQHCKDEFKRYRTLLNTIQLK